MFENIMHSAREIHILQSN